jgi:hypothetical protein
MGEAAEHPSPTAPHKRLRRRDRCPFDAPGPHDHGRACLEEGEHVIEQLEGRGQVGITKADQVGPAGEDATADGGPLPSLGAPDEVDSDPGGRRPADDVGRAVDAPVVDDHDRRRERLGLEVGDRRRDGVGQPSFFVERRDDEFEVRRLPNVVHVKLTPL